MRANISGASFPSELRTLLQRRLAELEKQLLRKVSNLEEEKSMLSNATAAYRLKTESTLNALVERISELEKGEVSSLQTQRTEREANAACQWREKEIYTRERGRCVQLEDRRLKHSYRLELEKFPEVHLTLGHRCVNVC